MASRVWGSVGLVLKVLEEDRLVRSVVVLTLTREAR